MITNHPHQKHRKLNVYFLLNKGVHILDLAGPMQAWHEASKRGAAIEVHYIGFESSLASHQGLQFNDIKPPPQSIANNSIIIVCASNHHDAIYTDSSSQRSMQWLNKVVNNHNYLLNQTNDSTSDPSAKKLLVVGICTGSILLAKSKLLDGRRCTTHHSLRGVIEQKYPKVQFEWDTIFLEDGNYITTAGVTAGLDVTLHLIERYFSYELSLDIARDLVVYRRRMSNDPQLSIHVQYRNHVHPLVHELQDYLQANFQTKISQQALAAQWGVSLRHLQRTFKQATGTTIHQYLTYYRTEHAKKMLTQHTNLEYIAHASGFPNSDSLRRCLESLDD